MTEHITIKCQTESQDRYVHFQETALRLVQQLSGEVWTDYNEHDPGVTILDALNYTLLESEYRLGFGLCDYLTSEQEGFEPQRHALFPATHVFPVNPVTTMDYRNLFLSSVIDLQDVRVVVSQTGSYDFLLHATLGTPLSRMTEIIIELYALFHSHRNLCESVNRICFENYVQLYLDVDMAIDEDSDANELEVRIFLEAQSFLSRGIRFRNVGDMLAEGKSSEQILEGADQGAMLVDGDFTATTEYDMSQLYKTLGLLNGVRNVLSLRLYDEARSLLEIGNEHLNYRLYPIGSNGHQIRLRREGELATIDHGKVAQMFLSMSNALSGVQNRTTDKDILDRVTQGKSRHFTHHNIGNDLPNYYKNNITDSFAHYLDMFDGLMIDSLSELTRVERWMTTDDDYLSIKKERWMDVLDVMYGEDSNPAFLRKYENAIERRGRRIRFLRDVPLWGLNREKALNLQNLSPDDVNESGLETYLKRVLAIERYGEFYLLEHNFLGYQNGYFTVGTEDAFCVSVIFVVEACWLDDAEFRSGCEQMLMARMPVHIQANIYWADKNTVAWFEFKDGYNRWIYSLMTGQRWDLENQCRELKFMLANDNNWNRKV